MVQAASHALSLRDKWTLAVVRPNKIDVIYRPTEKGAEFHDLTTPNVLLEGPRGTGKSKILRNDAHMWALKCPGLAYLLVRREMPDLRKSHLKFLSSEMKRLGGFFHKTESVAYYPNGSLGFYGHCETDDDVENYLSSEYARLYIDEMTTFPGEMILSLASTVRVPEETDWIGSVRGGTNPIGTAAEWVMRWYITKTVTLAEADDYNPDDYLAVKMVPADNPHMNWDQYWKRLGNVPKHIRDAWRDGKWVIEGSYFADFKPSQEGPPGMPATPWHVIDVRPTTRGELLMEDPAEQPWIAVYRVIDYGFDPDPAICLWIAVLPNGRAIVFKERAWWATTAATVAQSIARESRGMKVLESWSDPSMFDNSKATGGKSVGDIFEENGIALTPSVNDRAAAGYAIHEWLNTVLDDGLPKLQLLSAQGGLGCPELIRTLPQMRQNKTNPERIADGDDHYVMALAYFAMGNAVPSLEIAKSIRRPWMRAQQGYRIGAGNIREE